ncbi:MAG: DUF3866 family protein, partial [Coriobacteriales bacterium]|nr:DUF3866 family protein [Coriobacteriales bacterium]
REATSLADLAGGEQATITAIHYLTFASRLEPGQTVLLNVTALDLHLGTGGLAFVVPGSSYSDYTTHAARTSHTGQTTNPISQGHIMKLRYTPLQREVLAAEEPASPYHELLREADSLDGLTVICCGLHSQMPLVAAALKTFDPKARVVYCMTDEAALMAEFSDLVRQAEDRGLIGTTITCGQALGGSLEAVNLHSGLLIAHLVCQADYVITAIGPGVVGTGTAFGHGGIAQAEALNAVSALQGTPIGVLRVSEADLRERHRGLSHHSCSVLGQACLIKALLALPIDLDPVFFEHLDSELQATGISERHIIMKLHSQYEQIDFRDLNVKSMGRSQAEDPAFFKVATAAGVLAYWYRHFVAGYPNATAPTPER